MSFFMRIAGFIFLGTWVSCASWFVEQVPFTHSSLDFNQGKAHQLSLKNVSPEDATKKLIKVGKDRKFSIVKKECSDNECLVVFKSETVNKSQTFSTGGGESGYKNTYNSSTQKYEYKWDNTRTPAQVSTVNQELFSKVFVKLKKTDKGTEMEFVGVPVVRQYMSCPSMLSEKFEKCEVHPFAVTPGQTPAQSFRAHWAVDISGQQEAEAIQGIIAEVE
ncbi:MAG: hypothetical protein HYV97_02285 [Bdellovibrio sp.]|nr:hypothetical protein [Bdellovibrio sp.]